MSNCWLDPIDGSDSNDGLSAANAKASVAAAEAVATSAGDKVHVRCGTGVNTPYIRATLTCSNSGSSGNHIIWEADNAGVHWKGGGRVIWSGSDDDDAFTRGLCIDHNGHDYRTFRGFQFENVSNNDTIDTTSTETDWTIERCVFLVADRRPFRLNATNTIFRNCWVLSSLGCEFGEAAIVENCWFTTGDINLTADNAEFRFNWLLHNTRVWGLGTGTGASANNVHHNLWEGSGNLRANTSGNVVSDYNWGISGFVYNTVTAGSNDVNTEAVSYCGPIIHPTHIDFGDLFQMSGQSNTIGVGGTRTWPSLNGVPDQSVNADIGPMQRMSWAKESPSSNRIQIPPGVVVKGFVNVEASTAITIDASFDTDSVAITNEPSLVLLAALGVTEQEDPTADVENNGPEAVQVSGTPNANGRMMYELRNNDSSVTVYATGISAS